MLAIQGIWKVLQTVPVRFAEMTMRRSKSIESTHGSYPLTLQTQRAWWTDTTTTKMMSRLIVSPFVTRAYIIEKFYTIVTLILLRYNSPFRKCYPNCGNGEDADADDPYWYGGQWRKTFNGFDNRQGCSKWLIINGGMKRDLIESLQSRGYLEADMTATWMHNGFPTPTTTTPATTIPTRKFVRSEGAFCNQLF